MRRERMKRFRKQKRCGTRVAAVSMAAVLGMGLLTGCDSSLGGSAVFKIGRSSCSLSEAKILLVNYQNQYRDVYGVDLWRSTGESREELETYIKDLTISELAEIYMMAYIGQDQDLELSEEEEDHVKEAAAAYYQSLNETEKSYLDVSEKDVLHLYEQYALAQKVFSALTEDIEPEVSDDEARVMSVMQIYTASEDAAEAAYRKLTAGSEFAAVAAVYNKAESTSLSVARADVPEEAEETLFSLDNGTYTPVIPAEDGFYIYYCVNNYEEDLTEQNKATVLEQRMDAAVSTTYDTYTASTDSKLYTDRWNQVEINTDEALVTNSFFQIFEDLCRADYE